MGIFFQYSHIFLLFFFSKCKSLFNWVGPETRDSELFNSVCFSLTLWSQHRKDSYPLLSSPVEIEQQGSLESEKESGQDSYGQKPCIGLLSTGDHSGRKYSHWVLVTFSWSQIDIRHFFDGSVTSPLQGLGPFWPGCTHLGTTKSWLVGFHSRLSFHPPGTPQDLNNWRAAVVQCHN